MCSSDLGLSYYGVTTLARRLRLSDEQFAAARQQLIDLELIAYRSPLYQRRHAVVAQALGVRHRDQEQIQRGGARLTAVDEVLLYERLVNPAELLGDLGAAARAEVAA